MGIQDTNETTDTAVDAEFDEAAAEGLSDEDYVAAGVASDADTTPESSEFDELAAAGLSDDDYLAAKPASA
ncbi:hypothetical protein ACVWY0_001131 [Arthrobacter sp. UYNi723]